MEGKEIEKDDDGKWMLRIATSAMFFVAAFILSNLYLQIFLAFFLKLFNYTVLFTYSRVTALPVPNPLDTHHWSISKVLIIYLIPPGICFATAVILLLLVLRNSVLSNRFRLFIFWLIVCLPAVSFSQLLFGPVGLNNEFEDFYLTFAIVGTWLNMSFITMVAFAAIGVFASLIWGVMMGEELAAFTYSSRFAASVKSRILLAVQLYLLPLIVGSIPVILLSTKISFAPTVIILLNLGLLGLGIFMRGSTLKASANLRQHGVYLGAIEMNTKRTNSGNRVKRGKSRSLNRFPTVAFVGCVVLWLIIYFFFR